MKAAYYTKQGPASETLTIDTFNDPEPGAGEVRVRIHASGINPSDIKGRTGFRGPIAFPKVIPHQDGAGIIDRVGPGVNQDRLGERVWIYEAQIGRPSGTAAEYTVVPAQNAVPLPDGIDFEIGACLGVPALTAHRCLFADGDIKGKKVLVQGGAGAVGTAAILLAKWAGAWVVTTISRDEQKMVASDAGADLIINRKTEDVARTILAATQNQGVDRIVEVDLYSNFEIDTAVLNLNGSVNTYAAEDSNLNIAIPLLKSVSKGHVFRFVYVYKMSDDAHKDAISAINECLKSGAYKPHIGLRIPLDQIISGHEAQESGRVIGKIVINI